MATIELVSPKCGGCFYKKTTKIIQEFAREHDHTFTARDTSKEVNKRYAEKEFGAEGAFIEVIYSPETKRVIKLDGDSLKNELPLKGLVDEQS